VDNVLSIIMLGKDVFWPCQQNEREERATGVVDLGNKGEVKSNTEVRL